MTFERSVFINCPFDDGFRELLHPLLYTILSAGLLPRIALETADSGRLRLERIVDLIRESRYGIHDLSRIQAESAGELFRLNMPFELGLDFGCRTYGSRRMQSKRTLILESQPHRYQAALSDLAGCDIAAHGDDPLRLIRAVRDWLVAQGIAAPGAGRIWNDFTDFMAAEYERLLADGHRPEDLDAVPVRELLDHMRERASRT